MAHLAELEDEEVTSETTGWFLRKVAKELKETDTPYFGMKRRLPHLAALGEHIDPSIRAESLRKLKSFTNRGSIVLAFNNNLMRYKMETDPDKLHDVAFGPNPEQLVPPEIAFEIPDGKLPLDTVLAFEPMGVFEDEVLKSIV